MKIKYTKSKNSAVPASEIPVVVKVLRRLEKRDGAITPAAVVKESEPANAPLHKYFTWDNTKAAQAYREVEAQRIVRSVCIMGDDPEAEEGPLRAFVNVHAAEDEESFEGRGYISVVRAMQHPDYNSQVVQRAYEELVSWRKRYEALKQFGAIFQAIDATAAPAA